MIRCAAPLLVLLLALPAGAQARDDAAGMTPMWVLPGALQHTVNSDCSGTPRQGERAGLPEGLRVLGKPLDSCGNWVRIHVITGTGQIERLITAPSMLSKKPPKKDPWAGAAVLQSGWVRGGIWGAAVDGTDSGPTPLREGERVDVLDKNDLWVVRTSDGRSLALRYGAVEFDRDPVLQGSSGADRKVARDRWEAGRAARHQAGSIAAVPPSDELAANARAWKGRLYSLGMGAKDVDDEVFADGWLDPVQQTLRRACGSYVRSEEACGTYVLDYSAFGAWRPRSGGGTFTVLAELTGTETVDGVVVPKLRLLVLEPWKASGGVSPEWAEGSK